MESFEGDVSSPSSSVGEDFSPSFIGQKIPVTYHQPGTLAIQTCYDEHYQIVSSNEQRFLRQPPQQKRQRHRNRDVGEKNWRTDEIEKLVKLWGQNEELYNSSHPFYMDKEKKSEIVREIAKQLNSSELEVRRKMRSLQSYYCQLRRDRLNNKDGPKGMRKAKWSFFEMLKFLDHLAVAPRKEGSRSRARAHVTTSDYVEEGIRSPPNVKVVKWSSSPVSSNELSDTQTEIHDEHFPPTTVWVPGMGAVDPQMHQWATEVPPQRTINDPQLPQKTSTDPQVPERTINESQVLQRTPNESQQPHSSIGDSQIHKRVPNDPIQEPQSTYVPQVPQNLVPHHVPHVPHHTSQEEEGNSEQTEDRMFGDLVALKIGKINNDDIKEELKIEILQSILSAKRRAAMHAIKHE